MAMDAALMHATACAYALDRCSEKLDAALEACLPLCALVARRFTGRGAEYDDLFQVASLACIHAIQHFDPERGLKFTAYITPTVTGAVRNYVRDKAPLLRAPRALRQQAMDAERARDAFVHQHHAEPTARQLAEMLSWDIERVLTAWRYLSDSRVASLEETDGNGLTMAERLPFLEAGFEQTEQREDLARALKSLTEEEKALLSLRFTQRLSQRDTAARMNKTQMQISRMERRILAALRKELTEQP